MACHNPVHNSLATAPQATKSTETTAESAAGPPRKTHLEEVPRVALCGKSVVEIVRGVILPSLLGVGQRLVSLLDRLELFLCFLLRCFVLCRRLVRVVLQSNLAVRCATAVQATPPSLFMSHIKSR